MSARDVPAVGETWRSRLGGLPLRIVAVEDGFAYLKRADSTKRDLAHARGASVAALDEFARGEWVPTKRKDNT